MIRCGNNDFSKIQVFGCTKLIFLNVTKISSWESGILRMKKTNTNIVWGYAVLILHLDLLKFKTSSGGGGGGERFESLFYVLMHLRRGR